MRIAHLIAPSLVGLGLLASCGAEDPDAAGAADGRPAGGAPQQAAAGPTPGDDDLRNSGAPYGFEVWHDDFPGAPEEPHLSPRSKQGSYARTRSQAVDSVIGKLAGNCTRAGWRFAREVFADIEDPAIVDRLCRALDRAIGAPEFTDHAENLVHALARTGDSAAAPALLRALEHDERALREQVMQALVTAGDAESVRRAYAWFETVGGRGLLGWVRAAARHLPDDELVTSYRTLLGDGRFEPLRDHVMKQVLRLEPEVALRIVEPWIGREPATLRATIAVLRHLNGDRGGSAQVRDLFQQDAPQPRTSVCQALRLGGAEDFKNELLAATDDPDPTVRMEAVHTIAELPGDEVDLALESRTIDEFVDVRRAALRVLAERGHTAPLDELCHQVRQASGTRLHTALEDLIAARYVGAVPAIAERAAEAEGEERRGLLRAAALTLTAESFLPLREAFLADDPDSRSMRRFVAYLMANCRGAELAVLELFEELPREQYRERAWLMRTLGNIAGDREDDEVRAAIYGALREVFRDRGEIPQLRLLALEYVRRDLDFDDVVPIRTMLPDEEPPMRAALEDFLFEFF